MNELKRKMLSMSRKLEKVHVPEMGVDVYVRRMNGLERDEFQAAQATAQEEGKGIVAFLPLQSKIIAMTVCDERGAQIFEDASEVGEMDGLVVEFLSLKALEVNGMTRASRDAIEKKASATTGSGTI